MSLSVFQLAQRTSLVECRLIFSRIESAAAVEIKGRRERLYNGTKESIFATNSLMLLNKPQRMAAG
jgi:hypothetical protein